MNKLDILVPQYKEDDNVILPLLNSIALQRQINFDDIHVIICNDGSDVFLSEEMLSSYPFKIDYYKEPHRGVSGTRNACFDHGNGEYVMWCDIDDCFFNSCGLWMVFREIQIGFDALISCFVEELKLPDGKFEYVNRNNDSTFVHGKIYKRSYLVDQNIRWNDNLTIHEDSYFNILGQNLSKSVKYCQSPFYLWCWRDDSVCRHDPKYILKTYQNMIWSNTALVKEFKKRRMDDKARGYIAFLIFDAYYLFNKPEWKDQVNQQYRKQTEKEFAKYFKEFKDDWDKISDRDKVMISNGVRGRTINEGMEFETETLDQFLKRIQKIKI